MKTHNLTWSQDVWPWVKNRLASFHLVLGLFATVITLATVILGILFHIKTTAQSAVLDDSRFLGRLAEQVRPVCLLNSKGYIYDDYGALSFIDPAIKIDFANDGNNGGAGDGLPGYAETLSVTIHVTGFTFLIQSMS